MSKLYTLKHTQSESVTIAENMTLFKLVPYILDINSGEHNQYTIYSNEDDNALIRNSGYPLDEFLKSSIDSDDENVKAFCWLLSDDYHEKNLADIVSANKYSNFGDYSLVWLVTGISVIPRISALNMIHITKVIPESLWSDLRVKTPKYTYTLPEFNQALTVQFNNEESSMSTTSTNGNYNYHIGDNSYILENVSKQTLIDYLNAQSYDDLTNGIVIESSIISASEFLIANTTTTKFTSMSTKQLLSAIEYRTSANSALSHLIKSIPHTGKAYNVASQQIAVNANMLQWLNHELSLRLNKPTRTTPANNQKTFHELCKADSNPTIITILEALYEYRVTRTHINDKQEIESYVTCDIDSPLYQFIKGYLHTELSTLLVCDAIDLITENVDNDELVGLDPDQQQEHTQNIVNEADIDFEPYYNSYMQWLNGSDGSVDSVDYELSQEHHKELRLAVLSARGNQLRNLAHKIVNSATELLEDIITQYEDDNDDSSDSE